MNYINAGALFKVRKAARYFRLYGLTRTIVKIRAQYHMKAEDGFEGGRWSNPACSVPNHPKRVVAIVGCGNFAFSAIAYYARKWDTHAIRATYDINANRAFSLCAAYGGAYATTEWHAILDDPHVKIVFIASNHASHAEYAIACLQSGKHVHIEKPHVIDEDQLDRLTKAMKVARECNVFLGFNRPRSPLFLELQEVLRRQSGPVMINWFVAGHEIPADHWYFNAKEGGRVLGNLCHWTDLTLQLVGLEAAFPCTIVPATPVGASSEQTFVVCVMFADKSCAAITFSAKGHTFEGVREVLNLHKGDVLAKLTDFGSLEYDVVEKKVKRHSTHRDHGHGANIRYSLNNYAKRGGGESIEYIEATARLFLSIRRAIESGETVTLADCATGENRSHFSPLDRRIDATP